MKKKNIVIMLPRCK